MKRKVFLKNGLIGLGAIVSLPSVVASCSIDKQEEDSTDASSDNCALSPSETKSPFPILTPSQLLKSSIIGDREGVALLMTFTITDQSKGCTPLSDVWVDVWHCDKDGDYSQYGNHINSNFLRGRQITDSNGQLSFLSIFPGWYPGRAPHIHVEILNSGGNSLLITQIAFTESVYSSVYATSGYREEPDTSNTEDTIFSDSMDRNLADTISGNITDGYSLLKTIIVP